MSENYSSPLGNWWDGVIKGCDKKKYNLCRGVLCKTKKTIWVLFYMMHFVTPTVTMAE